MHLQKLSVTIDDFIRSTPYVSEDGAVTLGSKKTSVFEVEPKTGRVICSYTLSDSPSTFNSSEEQSVRYGTTNNNELVKSGLDDLNTAQLRLQIMRTDYTLKSFSPNSENVAWNMTIAEIGAALLCQDVENPFSGGPLNLKDKLGSEIGSDVALPLSCQSKAIIFRYRNHTLLESSKREILPGVHHKDTMLPMSDSGLMLPSQPEGEMLLDVHHDTMMLPAPMANPMLSLQSEASIHQNVGMFSDWSTTSSLALSIVIFMGIVIYRYALVNKGKMILSEQPKNSSSNSSTSKKKKLRKLGKSNGSVENKEMNLTSENENALDDSDGDNKTLSPLNKVFYSGANERRIGKLLVSNTEIAKGSNGTIVLEGNYEGRPVAVKRLVQAHHDVAFKEIQNLIASDQHPNIVRWYGVEYDQDFVYVALERCICSLDDLTLLCTETFQFPISGDDHATRVMFEYKTRLGPVKNIMPDINFWKASGHPSPLLIKLMRLVTSSIDTVYLYSGRL